MSYIQNLSACLEPKLWAFIIAAVPMVEMRAALPIAVWQLGLPPMVALSITYIGSMAPVWPLLLGLKPLLNALSHCHFFRPFVSWLHKRTLRKSQLVRKYSLIGLALFVAIPLPMTGVWTGSALAVFLKLPAKASFVALAIGNAIAGIILAFVSAKIF